MPGRALITGASSGIGEELARIHAAEGGDLVLVARSEEKLNALRDDLIATHSINVTVLVQDLAQPGAAQRVFEQTQSLGLKIDILINNAGFGGHGKFHQRALHNEQQMMHLNMVTLTELTHLYVQGMVASGSGNVLNVSSTAGFIPGPLQAVYYATKAYVTSFSQAVANELQGTGVTVTVLCPGPVDTGFQKAGDLEGVAMWKLAVSAESVARCGYRAMQKGELLVINQKTLAAALRSAVPLLPRKLLLKISRVAMEKR